MIEYKIWEGKWPHVVLISHDKAIEIMYYETGFEHLFPLPEIIDWMKERCYNYDTDWKVVRSNPDRSIQSEWAICFSDKKICELFVLKWL